MNSKTNSYSFELVTNWAIEHLENGTVPWKIPWTDRGLPMNIFTGRPYRSVNLWLLNALNFRENFFLTERQARRLGGWPRRGEEPQLVLCWKWDNRVESLAKIIPTVKPYYLYNIYQCAEIPDHYIPVIRNIKFDPIERAKEVVAAMPNKPEIFHRATEPYYQPVLDFISLPSSATFPNDEYYYATLFKLLVYSTSHTSRLNRTAFQAVKPGDFANHPREELAAEIGACYLCSVCGIDTWNYENRVANSQKWMEVLRDTKDCFIYAALQAQKAVDYILRDYMDNTPEAIFEKEDLQIEAYE